MTSKFRNNCFGNNWIECVILNAIHSLLMELLLKKYSKLLNTYVIYHTANREFN